MKIRPIIRHAGCNILGIYRYLRALPAYFRDRREFIRQRKDDASFVMGESYPILHEKYEEAGVLAGHYFHQDLLVARRIFENKPIRHVDLGSRTDGFVAHVAVFREIEILDIRPLQSKVKNITFRQADLMQLPEELIQCCDSFSSLHAIEHFGLGRYGDPIDYHGHEKAMAHVAKIIKPGGKFYYSAPMGVQRIEFNAHRIFSASYMMSLLTPDFIIDRFSVVDDMGDLHENVEVTDEEIAKNFGCTYGCAIIEMTRKN
jgi:SAM-dependent methyltransferase